MRDKEENVVNNLTNSENRKYNFDYNRCKFSHCIKKHNCNDEEYNNKEFKLEYCSNCGSAQSIPNVIYIKKQNLIFQFCRI